MPVFSVSARFSVAVVLALFSPGSASAQTPYVANPAFPLRFAAAHGQRALVGGNAAAGLEAWVYPLQILRDLKPSFVETGAAGAVPGERILRSMEYTSTTSVRTFAADDFTVHETLFVPRDVAGAVIFV